MARESRGAMTLTRRAFVGGLVGLSGVLAACGGKRGSSAGSTPSAAASTVTATPVYADASLLVEAASLAAERSDVHIIALTPAKDFADAIATNRHAPAELEKETNQ